MSSSDKENTDRASLYIYEVISQKCLLISNNSTFWLLIRNKLQKSYWKSYGKKIDITFWTSFPD